MAHHHHHEVDTSSSGQILIAGIALNLLFVVVEGVMGVLYNSLGLLSDAGHNLGDVFGLVMAYLAYKLARIPATKKYTYGYRKSTILVSLLNAIILLMAVGAIIMESIRKIEFPVLIDGEAVSWTAALGIVVNGVTTLMLMRTRKEDLNMRGAFLHMAADTLVSVGVLVSGIVITHTGNTIVDPIVGLVIAIVILISTWRLLADSLRLSLDGVPQGVDIDSIECMISSHEGVCEVHHIHIWAMSTTENALTAHIVIADVSSMELIKLQLKEVLAQHGIAHVTLEFETGDKCSEHDCECHS